MIIIDFEKCIGCWECFYLCPNENFTKNEKHKAGVRQGYCCLGCLSCLYACPNQCIDIQQNYD